MEWISLENQIPEEEELVFCCNKKSSNPEFCMAIVKLCKHGRILKGLWNWYGPEELDLCYDWDVFTHWLPLPEDIQEKK